MSIELVVFKRTGPLGIRLGQCLATGEIFIKQIRTRSDSYFHGVRQYDVIISVNGRRATDIDLVAHWLTSSRRLELELLRRPDAAFFYGCSSLTDSFSRTSTAPLLTPPSTTQRHERSERPVPKPRRSRRHRKERDERSQYLASEAYRKEEEQVDTTLEKPSYQIATGHSVSKHTSYSVNTYQRVNGHTPQELVPSKKVALQPPPAFGDDMPFRDVTNKVRRARSVKIDSRSSWNTVPTRPESEPETAVLRRRGYARIDFRPEAFPSSGPLEAAVTQHHPLKSDLRSQGHFAGYTKSAAPDTIDPKTLHAGPPEETKLASVTPPPAPEVHFVVRSFMSDNNYTPEVPYPRPGSAPLSGAPEDEGRTDSVPVVKHEPVLGGTDPVRRDREVTPNVRTPDLASTPKDSQEHDKYQNWLYLQGYPKPYDRTSGLAAPLMHSKSFGNVERVFATELYPSGRLSPLLRSKSGSNIASLGRCSRNVNQTTALRSESETEDCGYGWQSPRLFLETRHDVTPETSALPTIADQGCLPDTRKRLPVTQYKKPGWFGEIASRPNAVQNMAPDSSWDQSQSHPSQPQDVPLDNGLSSQSTGFQNVALDRRHDQLRSPPATSQDILLNGYFNQTSTHTTTSEKNVSSCRSDLPPQQAAASQDISLHRRFDKSPPQPTVQKDISPDRHFNQSPPQPPVAKDISFDRHFNKSPPQPTVSEDMSLDRRFDNSSPQPTVQKDISLDRHFDKSPPQPIVSHDMSIDRRFDKSPPQPTVSKVIAPDRHFDKSSPQPTVSADVSLDRRFDNSSPQPTVPKDISLDRHFDKSPPQPIVSHDMSIDRRFDKSPPQPTVSKVIAPDRHFDKSSPQPTVPKDIPLDRNFDNSPPQPTVPKDIPIDRHFDNLTPQPTVTKDISLDRHFDKSSPQSIVPKDIPIDRHFDKSSPQSIVPKDIPIDRHFDKSLPLSIVPKDISIDRQFDKSSPQSIVPKDIPIDRHFDKSSPQSIVPKDIPIDRHFDKSSPQSIVPKDIPIDRHFDKSSPQSIVPKDIPIDRYFDKSSPQSIVPKDIPIDRHVNKSSPLSIVPKDIPIDRHFDKSSLQSIVPKDIPIDRHFDKSSPQPFVTKDISLDRHFDKSSPQSTVPKEIPLDRHFDNSPPQPTVSQDMMLGRRFNKSSPQLAVSQDISLDRHFEKSPPQPVVSQDMSPDRHFNKSSPQPTVPKDISLDCHFDQSPPLTIVSQDTSLDRHFDKSPTMPTALENTSVDRHFDRSTAQPIVTREIYPVCHVDPTPPQSTAAQDILLDHSSPQPTAPKNILPDSHFGPPQLAEPHVFPVHHFDEPSYEPTAPKDILLGRQLDRVFGQLVAAATGQSLPQPPALQSITAVRQPDQSASASTTFENTSSNKLPSQPTAVQAIAMNRHEDEPTSQNTYDTSPNRNFDQPTSGSFGTQDSESDRRFNELRSQSTFAQDSCDYLQAEKVLPSSALRHEATCYSPPPRFSQKIMTHENFIQHASGAIPTSTSFRTPWAASSSRKKTPPPVPPRSRPAVNHVAINNVASNNTVTPQPVDEPTICHAPQNRVDSKTPPPVLARSMFDRSAPYKFMDELAPGPQTSHAQRPFEGPRLPSLETLQPEHQHVAASASISAKRPDFEPAASFTDEKIYPQIPPPPPPPPPVEMMTDRSIDRGRSASTTNDFTTTKHTSTSTTATPQDFQPVIPPPPELQYRSPQATTSRSPLAPEGFGTDRHVATLPRTARVEPYGVVNSMSQSQVVPPPNFHRVSNGFFTSGSASTPRGSQFPLPRDFYSNFEESDHVSPYFSPRSPGPILLSASLSDVSEAAAKQKRRVHFGEPLVTTPKREASWKSYGDLSRQPAGHLQSDHGHVFDSGDENPNSTELAVSKAFSVREHEAQKHGDSQNPLEVLQYLSNESLHEQIRQVFSESAAEASDSSADEAEKSIPLKNSRFEKSSHVQQFNDLTSKTAPCEDDTEYAEPFSEPKSVPPSVLKLTPLKIDSVNTETAENTPCGTGTQMVVPDILITPDSPPDSPALFPQYPLGAPQFPVQQQPPNASLEIGLAEGSHGSLLDAAISVESKKPEPEDHSAEPVPYEPNESQQPEAEGKEGSQVRAQSSPVTPQLAAAPETPRSVEVANVCKRFIKSQQCLARTNVKLRGGELPYRVVRTFYAPSTTEAADAAFARSPRVLTVEKRLFALTSVKVGISAHFYVNQTAVNSEFERPIETEAVTINMDSPRAVCSSNATTSRKPLRLAGETEEQYKKRMAACKLADELKRAGKFQEQQRHVEEVLEKRKKYYDESQPSTAPKDSSALLFQKDMKKVSRCIVQELIASQQSKGSKMFKMKRQASQESEDSPVLPVPQPAHTRRDPFQAGYSGEPPESFVPQKVELQNKEHVYSKAYKNKSFEEHVATPWNLHDLMTADDDPYYYPLPQQSSLQPRLEVKTDAAKPPMTWAQFREKQKEEESASREPLPPFVTYRSSFHL